MPKSSLEEARALLARTRAGKDVLALFTRLDANITVSAAQKSPAMDVAVRPPTLRLSDWQSAVSVALTLANFGGRLSLVEAGRAPDLERQSEEEFVRADLDDALEGGWSVVRVGVELLPLVSEKQQSEALAFPALATYFHVALGVPSAEAPSTAQRAEAAAHPPERLEGEKERWRAELTRRHFSERLKRATDRWQKQHRTSSSPKPPAAPSARASGEVRATLDEAKALLARTRFGGKAMVALGMSPLHVTLGSGPKKGDTIVFSDQEPVVILAVRLAALGVRVQLPKASEEEVRAKTLEIAADLARRVEGKDRERLEALIRDPQLALGVSAPSHKPKPPPPAISAALRESLVQRGYVYLGAFQVDAELVAGDSTSLFSNDSVRVPARGGLWHALARRFEPTAEAPTPDDTVGALLACHESELSEGFEPLLRRAVERGQAHVESGSFALVSAEWSDRESLEAVTEEVADEIGRVHPCRIGPHGCVSESGYGDGSYPVLASAAEDGKARLVVVRF